jgi:hypothetical protein
MTEDNRLIDNIEAEYECKSHDKTKDNKIGIKRDEIACHIQRLITLRPEMIKSFHLQVPPF